MLNAKYIVIGSGIFGSVIAERISSVLQESVIVVERRSHIGGNCYSHINDDTGIECHCYGSHIFHTSNEKVWRYINQFAQFTSYRHKVIAISNGQAYFMPINLKTLCDIYHKTLTPSEAQQMLTSSQKDPNKTNNLEEKAIALIGTKLYHTFIRGYTLKQWNKDPKNLPAEIITRLPVRTNYNTDYFNDLFQGIPVDGYGELFKKLLSGKRINVLLNTDFAEIRNEIPPQTQIIFTGMIDEFFDYRYGALEWRSLHFEWETLPIQDYQGTSVINYVDAEIPFTRIHEFKHYHPERTAPFLLDKTIICREYPQEWAIGKEAYYPINTQRNQSLLKKYQLLAAENHNLTFGGRLGCYCYWDMDKAILNALNCFENKIMRNK